jgi:hypothetical protein
MEQFQNRYLYLLTTASSKMEDQFWNNAKEAAAGVREAMG